ncbi:MAG: hypothetical protein KKB85_00060 [Candidatus Altiarchaeota archaeon]|nr:hypothetical protein [Candidatus Altiarchaeota archaeon]
MRNQKTLIAVVAFLLLFSSAANAGWWDEIKECYGGPQESEGVGIEKVRELCNSTKSEAEGSTGELKARIENVASATEEIDALLETYEGICDEIPVDELEVKAGEIGAWIEYEIEPLVKGMEDKYAADIRPKMDEIESKAESSAREFGNLCGEELVRNADEKISAVGSDMDDAQGWLNGLPDDASSIIIGNGGDDATYEKFRAANDKLESAYELLGSVREIYANAGELCGEVLEETGGAIEELRGSFDELGGLCGQTNEFIEDEAIKPLEDIMGSTGISQYVGEKLTALCDDMKRSVDDHVEESERQGIMCESLEESISMLEYAVDFLDVFMEFRGKAQKYLQCFNCLDNRLSKLGARQSAFEAQSSQTCDAQYEDAKAMYAEFFNAVNKRESYEYLFAIYQDPEFEANARQADREAESYRAGAMAYLEFDPAQVSNAEGCGPDTASAELYGWGNEILSGLSEEAGTAKFTLYSVLAGEYHGVVNFFAGILAKLGDILGNIFSVVTKVLNVFFTVFTALTDIRQKIADSEERVGELATVANKQADKLRDWMGTPYMELPVMDEKGIPMDPNVQDFAYTFYGLFSPPKDMHDRSPESYGEVEVNEYMGPIYRSKKSNYIEFIEEWNKNIGYDVVELIKEMPVTAATSPVEIDLDYGSPSDKLLANNPSPICKVKGLFRTNESKGKEGWAPLEMPYEGHEAMWTEIFGITPDIEMRHPDCDILIYNFASEVEDTYLDLTELLNDDNYQVQYRERAGNDITGEMLSDYCQAWFIDAGEAASITAAEIGAIGDFLDGGGSVLLTGDLESFSNMGQIAAGFGVEISGLELDIPTAAQCIDIPTAAQCIYPSFIAHDVTNGVTSISSHGIFINSSDFDADEICTHSRAPCTIVSDDGGGGGKMIFDSSSKRFSSVLECENSRYALNIARFLSLERWSKTGDIKVYAGGGCTRYHEGTNIEDHRLYCENPLTLTEGVWSPKSFDTDLYCSWVSNKTVCWKGGNDRGTAGWYHGPIEDWVNVTVVYEDEDDIEHRDSYVEKGKPHMDDEDTVNSYFVVDAEIPKEARNLSIEAKYSCNTTFNRQVYHVTCVGACLFETNAGDSNTCYCTPAGCWYNNGKNVGCEPANTETIIDTSSVTDTWDEIDSWMDADALVRDGEMTSLGVDMDGAIRPYGDEGWTADLTLRATPDIISGFSMTVGEHSFINFRENFYPVKHEMFRRYSASGPDKKEYNIIDRYGLDSSEYDYLRQCKEICLLQECECPDSILEPFCWDMLSDTGYSVRTDCACLPREGQEDLCASGRSFQEDVGIYYDFVRLTAYDMDEMSLMGNTLAKTISRGLLTVNEIDKGNGLYPISFTTGTMTHEEPGETIHVTEDELRNAKIIAYTPFEATEAKNLSEWIV